MTVSAPDQVVPQPRRLVSSVLPTPSSWCQSRLVTCGILVVHKVTLGLFSALPTPVSPSAPFSLSSPHPTLYNVLIGVAVGRTTWKEGNKSGRDARAEIVLGH
jgi:hypothetical protein